MNQERYFWLFDRTIFDQIRLPGFHWLEGVLIVLALCAFAAYFLFIKFLDRRVQHRFKLERQAAQVARMLDKANLPAQAMATVNELAAGEAKGNLYNFLTQPELFETAVHRAIRAGQAERLDFIDDLRSDLGFHSDNLRAPIVSTRQLEPGNAVRIAVWSGGLPQHFYGTVAALGAHFFAVTLREEAVKAVLQSTDECALYHVRGLDVEYRFPCRAKADVRSPSTLQIAHTLVSVSHGVRGSRLPLLRDIEYQLVRKHVDPVSELDPDLAPTSAKPALLFDLSEGGFAIVTNDPVVEGRLLRINLPLKKGRGHLALTGKIRESRAFSGNQWMTRCEMRGLTPQQRNYLQQILRVENQRRMKTMAPVRRAMRAEESPHGHRPPSGGTGESAAESEPPVQSST